MFYLLVFLVAFPRGFDVVLAVTCNAATTSPGVGIPPKRNEMSEKRFIDKNKLRAPFELVLYTVSSLEIRKKEKKKYNELLRAHKKNKITKQMSASIPNRRQCLIQNRGAETRDICLFLLRAGWRVLYARSDHDHIDDIFIFVLIICTNHNTHHTQVVPVVKSRSIINI